MGTKLVKGAPVVSLADGRKLGVIDHVYLDPRRKEIVAFSFHRSGLFAPKACHLLDVADVHGIGPDAVTLDDPSAVRSEVAVGAKRDDLVDLEDLLKRKVITEGGTLLGQVAAIGFGQDTYRLLEVEVSPGFFEEPVLIPAEAIVRIGSELVVVSDEVCGQALPDLSDVGVAATVPKLVAVA